MTEQELIQENEKLKGRLAKAIEVFKEQKDSIATLTQERDKAKAEINEQTAKIQKLEEKVAKAAENDDKFFEQEEIGKLNEQLTQEQNSRHEAEAQLEKLGQKYKLKKEEIVKNNITIEELKAQNQNLIVEHENEISDQKVLIADRDKIIDELRETISRHVEKAGSMSNDIENLNKYIEQLSKELSRIKKERDELDIDFRAVQEENENLKKETEEQHDRIENLSNALDKAHENFEQERKNTDILLTNLENCFKEGLRILKDNR